MADFTTGLNDPSPVSRVIVFGYQDGATDGVMELDGGLVYRFEFLGETRNADGPDVRRYELCLLPADAFEQLTGALGEHLAPEWPVWLPIWKFPTEQAQAAVEQQVDAILERVGEASWRITTTDTLRFGTLTAVPHRTAARVA